MRGFWLARTIFLSLILGFKHDIHECCICILLSGQMPIWASSSHWENHNRLFCRHISLGLKGVRHRTHRPVASENGAEGVPRSRMSLEKAA